MFHHPFIDDINRVLKNKSPTYSTLSLKETSNLHDYQVNVITQVDERVRKSDAGVFLDMATGTGKTLTATTLAIKTLKKCRSAEYGGNVLVVLRSNLQITWLMDIYKHTNIPPTMIRLFSNHREKSPLEKGKPCIVILPYTLLRNEDSEKSWLFNEKNRFSLILADEAQDLISKRSQTRQKFNMLKEAHPTSFKVLMSAEFLKNSYRDLASLTKILTSDKKWSAQSWGRNRTASDYILEWKERWVITVTKADAQSAVKLPEKIVHDTTFIELTGIFKLFEFPLSVWYTEFVENECEEDENNADDEDYDDQEERKPNILQRITMLRQITSHPALLKSKYTLDMLRKKLGIQPIPKTIQSPKTQWICDTVKSCLARHPDGKIIVFSQFLQFLDILRPFLLKLPGVKLGFIHGKINQADREDIQNNFKYTDKINVLIATTGTTGTGLNLNTDRYSFVIHSETNWNSAIRMQGKSTSRSIVTFSAEDRIWRQGQTQPVEVFSCVTNRSIEYWIYTLVKAKDYESDWRVGHIKPDREKIKLKSILLKYRTGVKVDPYYQDIVHNIFDQPSALDSRKKLKKLDEFASKDVRDARMSGDDEQANKLAIAYAAEYVIKVNQPIVEELLYDQLLLKPVKWQKVFQPFDPNARTWCILELNPRTRIVKQLYVGEYHDKLQEEKESLASVREESVLFLLCLDEKQTIDFSERNWYNIFGIIELSTNERFKYLPKVLHVVKDDDYADTLKTWKNDVAGKTDYIPFIIQDIEVDP